MGDGHMRNTPPAAPIMGSGRHRYRCQHDWGRLPETILWGKTHAVVIDAQERVYIGHTSRPESPCQDTVVVFDREGNFLHSWGAEHAGHTHGLLLAREADGREVLYLTNDREGVFKTTLDGTLLQRFPKPEFYEREGLKFGPANVALAPNGDVYLAEGYGAAYVLRYEATGRYLGRFGGRGDAEAHTTWAHGAFIATVAGEPLLHVCVDAPSAIKRFMLAGEYHSLLPGTFLHPRNIYAQGNRWAIPEMQGRLTLLDHDTGETVHLGHWGKTMDEIFALRREPRETFPVGAFVSAHGAAFFPNGDLIVTEWVEVGRVNRLTRLPAQLCG